MVARGGAPLSHVPVLRDTHASLHVIEPPKRGFSDYSGCKLTAPSRTQERLFAPVLAVGTSSRVMWDWAPRA